MLYMTKENYLNCSKQIQMQLASKLEEGNQDIGGAHASGSQQKKEILKDRAYYTCDAL